MASFDGIASSDELAVTAPMAGVVVAIARGPHERVATGMPVVVLEAMKMEHEVLAEGSGVVRSVEVAVGDAVQEGQLLVVLTPSSDRVAGASPERSKQSRLGREPISRRCARATLLVSMQRDPRRWRAAASEDDARRERTSQTSSTRAPSWSTAP